MTVDNADSGHARKAWEALHKLMPQVGDAGDFMRRVDAGYRLNDLGASTASVIGAFDLHAELVGILRAKSAVGKNMHSDYCKVGGRSLNDWLSDPDQVPALLAALEAQGWFTRGQDPEESRFWAPDPGRPCADVRRVQRLRAAGAARLDRHAAASGRAGAGAAHGHPPRAAARRRRHRRRRRAARRESAERGIIRHRFPDDEHAWEAIACELRLLEAKLAASDSKEEAIAMLTALMSPASHHTSAGLMATRIFSKLFA